MRKILILCVAALLLLPLLPILPVAAESYNPYLVVNATERLTVADVVSPRYAPDGSYIAFIAKGPSNTIVNAQPDGSNQHQLAFISNPIWSLTFKPDGAKLALIVATTGRETGTVYTDVVTVGADGKGVKFLTNSTNYNSDPVFLPDGRIAYTTQQADAGVYQVWVMQADGSEQRIWINPGLEPILLGVSPTREEVLFMGKPSGSSTYQLFLCDLNAGNVRQITSVEGGSKAGVFSPDGERIAFVVGESGQEDLAIVNRDGSNAYRLSTMGSSLWRPSWSPDGQFVLFPAVDSAVGKYRIYVVRPDSQDLRLLSPDFLPSVTSQVQWQPGGSEVIFLAAGDEGTNNIWRMKLGLAVPVPPPPPPPVEATPTPSATPPPINAAFADIAGHWAEKDIAQLKDEGIIQGYPDGTFRPENSLKRVEFAAFLLRTLGYPEVADIDPFFADVPGSYWGFGTIQGLVLKHIVARDTNFYPEDKITRLEIIQWEVRALGLEDQTVNRVIPALPFSDLSDLSVLEQKYVATAYELQLISGYPDGSLNPWGFATRAEATALLFRLMANLP